MFPRTCYSIRNFETVVVIFSPAQLFYVQGEFVVATFAAAAIQPVLRRPMRDRDLTSEGQDCPRLRNAAYEEGRALGGTSATVGTHCSREGIPNREENPMAK